MAIERYAESRDRGLAVRRYEFRYGPNRDDYFAYTDAPEQIVGSDGGRHRLYISIDRSKHMADRNRLSQAQSAVVYALERIRDDIAANGTVYDITVSQFSWTEGRIRRIGASTGDINTIINWVNGLAVTTAEANYDEAVRDAAAWFGEAAGQYAVYRNWIFLTHGECNMERLSDAKEIASNLISFRGAEDSGFISTDIYPLLVGSRDDRNIRWLRNTPHFPIDVLESGISTQVWRRVGAVQRAAFVYNPLPITTTEIKTNGAPEEKNEVRITIPKNCGLANYYRDQRVQRPMQVAIFEGQADDPDGEFRLLWTGKIMSAKRLILQNTVELSAQPHTSAYKRSGLTRTYSYGCPHALYGSMCGADRSRATVNFQPTLNSWDESSKTLDYPDGLLGGGAQRYAGGTAHWTVGGNTIYRNIVEVKSNRLLLDGPIGRAHDASRIYITLGCDHTPEFCRNHHVSAKTGQSNIVNYGGCDKIPTINPFRTTSNFY